MHTTTHTKNALMAGVAVALILLTASCYWNPQGGAGKITINLKSASRAQVDPTVVQYARVHLYADNMNSRINIGDGVPYAEATMSPSGGAMTVNHVPTGNGYKVVLTLGSKPDGATYVPGKFGMSDSFSVTANHETAVSIASVQTLNEVLGGGDLEYDLLGKNLNSVVVVQYEGPVVGATDSGNFYFGGIDYFTTTTLTGYTVNSVSGNDASSAFIVNTDRGMLQYYSYDGHAYDPDGVFALPTAPTGSVVRSGGYYDSVAGANVYYYVGPHSFGGVVSGSSSWVNVDLGGSTAVQPVFDLSLGGGSSGALGFFATPVGAFAVSSNLVNSGSSISRDLDYITKNGNFFHVPTAEMNLFITSVAIDQSYSTDLYVGTIGGAYYADVTSLNKPPDDAPITIPLSGSTGYFIRKVLAGPYLVALGNNLIFVYAGGYSSSPAVIPVQGVTLGELRAIAVDTSYGDIYIAGSKGITRIPLVLG